MAALSAGLVGAERLYVGKVKKLSQASPRLERREAELKIHRFVCQGDGMAFVGPMGQTRFNTTFTWLLARGRGCPDILLR